MPIMETFRKWEFAETTSTGALKAFDARARHLGFYIETGPGCAATVNLQARIGSSAGAYATLSTTALSTGQGTLIQFLGPLMWVRPYCQTKTTGALTVTLVGN